jgi:hypothetical protein
MRVSKNIPAIQGLIDKLEAAGYEINLRHYPDKEGITGGRSKNDSEHFHYTSFHGMTRMEIKTGGVTARGDAFCSVNDQFCRAEGTRFAFNRAIHELSHAVGRDVVKGIFA